jgi:putative sigma-54 modulation protein
MRLELTGRHVEITPALRRLVNSKLAKLERLLQDRAVSAQVVLTHEKHRRRADITLHARGEKFLHGVGDSSNWETSVKLAIDKIAQQAQRMKGKWQGRKRQRQGEEVPPPVGPAPRGGRVAAVRIRMPPILRAERQGIKSMSVADAAREARASGDGIVVFRDRETESIAVLYRRNGELTLVETET